MTNTKISKSTPSFARAGIAPRALVASLAGAMLALTGCGPEMETGGLQAEREIVEYSPELLGEFETAEGVRLTFTAEYESGDGSGDPVVAITELAPINAPSYLERFRERGATSLEAFLALAPEGTEVPAVLRVAHEREASRLERSTEVRELSPSEVSMLATPYASSTCDSYSAFTSSVSSWLSSLTGSSIDNHWLSYQKGGNVAASMCNFKSNRVDYKYAQFCFSSTLGGGGLLTCESKIIVPDGYRVSKSWLNATTDRLVRAEKLENYTLSVTSFIAIGGIPPVP